MQDNEVYLLIYPSKNMPLTIAFVSLSCVRWQRFVPSFSLIHSYGGLTIHHPTQLVATNNPDKIIFVGEALVGNEAVDQLTKFDRALRDFSAASGGQELGIDGMLVTKWDTVDDKVRSQYPPQAISPQYTPIAHAQRT